MADHDEEERTTILMEATLGATYLVREFLAELPIPVVVPELVTETTMAPEAVLSLNRARALIDDEPISEHAKIVYRDLILEWFTAYEILVLRKIAGPAPWRLDIAEYALERFGALAELIESGEVDNFGFDLDES
ncbi:hypothetical protein [Streptomyces sp. CC224B]|uniref:hypothetical protein n=1 Tax=Streptomyces sp. CC224B TaxID=3044571 RepID=UPI0024A7E0CB|nr:hypothetical protein [Streptomyces sp. CC224B]